MQRDSMAGMDLTADPRHKDPSPGAKVVRLARRRRAARARLDLAEEEEPSTAGEVVVHRGRCDEASTISAELRLWKVFHARVAYRVPGPVGWAASLYVAVLFLAIVAAVAVPTLVLPDPAPLGLRLLVAVVSGGPVLAMAPVAINLLHRRS
jgi:hypothetical protein